MRRLLILTLPVVLTTFACDSGGDEGDRNADIKALSGDAASGQALFASKGCNIDSCHGADGNSGTTAPRLADITPMRTDDQIIDSVLDGRESMPPQSLEDQEMADVLAWIRSNF